MGSQNRSLLLPGMVGHRSSLDVSSYMDHGGCFRHLQVVEDLMGNFYETGLEIAHIIPLMFHWSELNHMFISTPKEAGKLDYLGALKEWKTD